jgi:phosphoribosylamine--glycine ligase
MPLALGLADRLRAAGFAVFGPSAAAARLESSKAFAKDLMSRHGVPTARFRTFEDAAAARRHCREIDVPLVIKADGLAAGKGVIVCRTLDEADRALGLCFEERAFGASGLTIVIEEFLEGEEASFFARRRRGGHPPAGAGPQDGVRRRSAPTRRDGRSCRRPCWTWPCRTG